MKRIHTLSIALATLAAVQLCSCKKGLDYNNVSAMSPENVWKDSTMIQAYLSDIYGGLMPGWPFNGSDADEGISTPRSLDDYRRGIISVSNTNTKLDYQYIEKINYFLDNLQRRLPPLFRRNATAVLPEKQNSGAHGATGEWYDRQVVYR